MSSYNKNHWIHPTSGCPYCLDDNVKSYHNYETEVHNLEVARAMMAPNITGWQTPARESRSLDCQNSMHYLCNGCLSDWLQHNSRERLQTFTNHCIQCDAVHPKTRNKGMAGPVGGRNAEEVALQNERAADTELWYTKWVAKKRLYTGFVKNNNCATLSDVMTVMLDKSAIGKTKVAPSGFVHNSKKGKEHSGLFVKAKMTVYAGEVCAVLCSNQKKKLVRPLHRQAYHINALSAERPEYFLLFSINREASIIGAAANAHFHDSDPISNAIYKQLPVTINGKFLALTVLVATKKISPNCEVVMDYGSGFGEDITEPMDLNAHDDEEDDEDEEDDDDSDNESD